MTPQRIPPRAGRSRLRWALGILLALAAAGAYRHYTDPARLRAAALRALSRSWRGGLSLRDIRYTPWGGLLIRDLAFSAGAEGRLTIPQVRARLSPLRALVGEAMLSDLEIQGAVLELPAGALDGPRGFPRLPFAPASPAAAERRGTVLVTVSEGRVTVGTREAMALPLVAAHCRYLSAAGTTDLTGEVKGPAWTHGSFRASWGGGVCRWDGALHGLALSPELRGLLWPRARSVWDLFSPSGTVDLSGRGTAASGSAPAAYTIEIASQDAEITFRPFPVTFQRVHGTVAFDEGGRVDLRELWGYGAGALTTCDGAIVCKGDHPYTDLELTVQDLPLVPAVLGALPEGVRASLAWAGAQGQVSGRLRILHSEALPEPFCFSASATTGNLILQGLPLQPMIRDGRMTLAGRVSEGRPVEVAGVLEVPLGEISGRAVSGVRGRFRLDGHALAVDLDGAGFSGGTVTGRLVRERRDGDYANRAVLDLADARIEQMKQGTLLADQAIHGTLSTHLELDWKGSDATSLKGRGEAALENGYLFALPPLSRPLALLSLNTQREPVIRDGRMDFRLDAGTLTIDRLELPSDQVTVRADGSLRSDGAVDLRVVANLGRGKTFRRIPVLKETTEGLQRFVSWLQARGLYVYRVTGTVKDPKVERVQLFLAKKDVEVYHKLLQDPDPRSRK